MKTFISALLLLSAPLFAQDLDATEALLSTLSEGKYSGLTPENKPCNVEIKDLQDKVIITAKANGIIKKSVVSSGAIYRWNPGQRSFLATTIDRSDDVIVENIFRTIAVKNTTQYIVVSDLVHSGRNSQESLVECVVDLI